MATLTFQVVSGANTFASSKTISATDLQRLLTAYQAIYKTAPTDAVPNPPALTNQQVVDAISLGFFKGMASVVKRSEQDTASANATAGIADVVIS